MNVNMNTRTVNIWNDLVGPLSALLLVLSLVALITLLAGDVVPPTQPTSVPTSGPTTSQETKVTIRHFIDKPGNYRTLRAEGYAKDRDTDRGLLVRADSGVVYIDRVVTNNMFVPVTLEGKALVIIGTLEAYGSGGDVLDIWDSNVYVHEMYWEGNKPTRPYRVYHPDIVQMDLLRKSKSVDGVLQNVTINSMEGEITSSDTGCVTLSGRCRYTDIHIGNRGLKVRTAGEHFLNAYQLDNSVVGAGTDNISVNGDVYINNRGQDRPPSYNVQSSVPFNPHCTIFT